VTIITPQYHLPTAHRTSLKRRDPQQQLSTISEAVKFAISVRQAENSLYDFVKQAWHIVEPGVEFSEGWHLQVICEHLEAVSDGRIKNLIINIPPRHSKSTVTTVIWPVWAWLHNPSEKFLTASYSSTLSTRDAVKSRRLLTSPWFLTRWPHLSLTSDQNTKARYENEFTGYRIATSVGGTATGEGGSTLIQDDPMGAQDAQSQTVRESTLEWTDMVWSSRKNDPRTSKSVVIQQRLHMKDTTGHLLSQGGWELLCLPAEYDGIRRKTSLGEYDKRTEVGELLWPNRFGRAELETLKTALGTYGTSGQLQQNPVPIGSGILKTQHVKLWSADLPLPSFDFILMSMDTAYTEKTQNDPSGCIVFGVFEFGKQKNAMVLDAWAEHLPYPDLKVRVMEDWKSRYGGQKDHPTDKGRRPDLILIEAKASGLSLLQDLRLSNIPAVSYNPGRADKIQRAHISAPILENEAIWVLESKNNRGYPVSWAQAMIKEWESFPVAEHDEYVDCLSQAVIYLKDAGFLDVPVHEDDDVQERYADNNGKSRNPYSC
jgi:hypothetical protein